MAERLVGQYHEGAAPPARFVEYATDFANLNPHATRKEWHAFSAKLAGEAYRAGFQRGYEHAERDPEPGFQRLPPELVADQEDPEWRHPSRRIVGPELANPLDQVDEVQDGGNE